MPKVAILVGSLRKESMNKQLAEALVALSVPFFEASIVSLADIPLFNQDLESSLPEAVAKMKDAVSSADGVLLVTPEYNRNIPGVLKNALDWGSRPYGQSCWSGKPVAITGASAGTVATAAAQSVLRGLVTYLGMRVMVQPEAYVRWTSGYLVDGAVADEKNKAFLQLFLKNFSQWING